MLKAYDNVGNRDEVACDISGAVLPPHVVWLDLLDPAAEEVAFAERLLGISLPRDESLGELQTATRLRVDGEVIQAFTPVVYRDAEKTLRTTNVGFVLSPTLLVTIRTETLRSFRDYIERNVAPGDQRELGAMDVFLGLLETVMDRLSDGMEHVGSELDDVSRQIFNGHLSRDKRRKPIKAEADLQGMLLQIGSAGDLTSTIRDSLLGIGRVMAFVAANGPDKMPSGARTRMKTVRQDIASLNDYETRLTDKVQFLLDSTLGLISIEQNRTFKLLTIFSVLGIPPTFVVGLYGMNFKNMPELDWAYGYQWGLLLVALSILVPAIWLRLRGWM